ncbi:dipeptide epimerase [Sphingomonas oligophenolica]|uniref:Dipeptide epimerase n=1 Tax=Sphingomonas oligophenolica TaxID=301154 RepID=A0ABU9Y7D2_9SPHN
MMTVSNDAHLNRRDTGSALTLSHYRDAMVFREPFRISGYLFESMPAVIATISDDEVTGRGEAAGVYYLDDDSEHMEREIERCREAIESGISRQALRALLPPGGARNALDCALWELESLRAGVPVWQLAGVGPPRPLVTTFTLPADDPAEILRRLEALPVLKAIKLKLEGDLAADSERVKAVRNARPHVWLGVDANQGYDGDDLDGLVAMLVDQKVSLLEQPIRRGAEALLDGWQSPVPVAADESVLDLAEIDLHRHRFQVINIKLDKCGGLTEALMMADHARRLGLKVMVGNMAGATLSIAPAFVLGQACDVVDLDGPWFLADDPLAAQLYADGSIMVPAALWGAA